LQLLRHLVAAALLLAVAFRLDRRSSETLAVAFHLGHRNLGILGAAFRRLLDRGENLGQRRENLAVAFRHLASLPAPSAPERHSERLTALTPVYGKLTGAPPH
ncbi:MAG: hypothetical protein QGF90_14640, partial [Gammaproteobacteria bacterium]|nr:hypothetical protein [Gammaproteobacteria bacterium]